MGVDYLSRSSTSIFLSRALRTFLAATLMLPMSFAAVSLSQQAYGETDSVQASESQLVIPISYSEADQAELAYEASRTDLDSQEDSNDDSLPSAESEPISDDPLPQVANDDADSAASPDESDSPDQEMIDDEEAEEIQETELADLADEDGAESESASRAIGSFSCDPNLVYALTDSNRIYKIDSGSVTQVTQVPITYATNGLGISADGEYAYAVIRTWFHQPGRWGAEIHRYSAATGNWDSRKISFANNHSINKKILAGAVDPKTGVYYFGTTHSGAFYIYRYDWDSQAQAIVGYFSSGSGSADMAFSQDGTLYIVSNDRIYSVNPSQLQNPTGGRLDAQTGVMVKPTNVGANINGLAFDPEGYVYLSTTKTVYKFSPSDGSAPVGSSSTVFSKPGLGSEMNDLASCGFSPVLEVQKQINGVTIDDQSIGRIRNNDQFYLELRDQASAPGSPPYGSTFTTGTDLGLQNQQINQMPVVQQATYVIREAMAQNSSSSIDQYHASVECQDQNNQNQAIAVTPSQNDPYAVEIKIPTITDPANPPIIKCKFINTPKTLDLKVLKVDSATNNPITGAKFNLWLDVNKNGSLEKVAGDTLLKENLEVVNQDGTLFINDLFYGEYYLLEEIQAPENYLLPESPVTPIVPVVDNWSLEGENEVTIPVANERQFGSVSWSKVAGDINGPALAGSEWVITDKKDGTKTWVVKDCVTDAAECDAVFVDTNKAAGEFTVLQLPLGEYTLKESKAPAGYKLDSTSYSFQITAQNPDFKFDDGFINEQVVPPVIPVTGGVGSDFYLISGGVLLAAGAAAGYAQNLRRNRKRLNATKSNKEDI